MTALFLGSLSSRKGIEEVLAAAKILQPKPIRFVLVGDDTEGRGAAAFRGNNIERFPRVPRHEVADIYRRANVFLFPTHSDGFGLTQIEAMSEGLPVIASKNCARLVDHGRTGFLMEEVSAASLVEKLLECLEDRGRLERMGAAAREAAVEFQASCAEEVASAIFDTGSSFVSL